MAQAGGAGAGTGAGAGSGGVGSGGAETCGREVCHKSEQVPGPEHTGKAPSIVVKRERAQVPEHVDLGVKVERDG